MINIIKNYKDTAQDTFIPRIGNKSSRGDIQQSQGEAAVGVTYTTNSEVVMIVKNIPFEIEVKWHL